MDTRKDGWTDTIFIAPILCCERSLPFIKWYCRLHYITINHYKWTSSSYHWLSGKLWYLQHNCVGDTIDYHWASAMQYAKWHQHSFQNIYINSRGIFKSISRIYIYINSRGIFKTIFTMPGAKYFRWNMFTPSLLTHWGRVTHICVGKQTIIGSDNGLSPGRRQAITWTNAGILLIGPFGTNFSEISIKILTFSFTKMRLKVSSAKWRPSVNKPSLVQIMACRLDGAKPLPEPMLEYC